MRRFPLSIPLVLLILTPLHAQTASAPAQPVVAIFELDGPVVESAVDNPFAFNSKPIVLRDLVRRMHDAAADQNVKAVVLLAEHIQAAPGDIEEIRQSIQFVRDHDKDVLVHADSLGMPEYLLFSAA